MGLVCYREKDSEIYEGRVGKPLYRYKAETVSAAEPLFKCNYCDKSFYSKDDLYAHINEAHANIKSLLVVNGMVVHGDVYLKELHSIYIVRYNLNEKFLINGFDLLNSENEIDLFKIASDLLNKDGILKITVGEIKYQISLISQQSINGENIKNVVYDWNSKIAMGHSIQKYDRLCFNALERRCLDGFFNYFIAVQAEGKDKTDRYNDAIAILSEFSNILPIARFLTKVISFKYNWVQRLETLAVDNDIMLNMDEFFHDYQPITDIDLAKMDLNIFIEDNLEEVIQLISKVQKGEQSAINLVLSMSYKDILKIEDINQRDKICLLKARLHKVKGDNRNAKRYYDELQIVAECIQEERKKFYSSI